ncbi:RDD family protein [Nordella sp. HKS 07]|uniref:RDD family protein n=1 Tax=Nordella sp. HKS 07 TaxID=2712222 RepID=UPI0013E1CBEC|nr:RDD family protein [Nordella sp. HKS 07]QIG47232.1 RDD family protein [Nordella sp. HKS 07]
MSVAEWFFLNGVYEAGPFTRDQIQSLISVSSINGETLLWRPGCVEWMPASTFAQFYVGPQQPSRNSSWHESTLHIAPREDFFAAPHEPPALVDARQWMDETPHPWRRNFARCLDMSLWTGIIMLLIGIGLTFLDPQIIERITGALTQPGSIAARFFLAFVLALIPNALLIGLTGGTLGKWLFGVRVLDETDRPIGVTRSFKREARVFCQGLGLGIPIVSLITLFIAYRKLKMSGATGWDQALHLKVVQRRNGLAQYLASAVGIALLIVITGEIWMLAIV